MIEDHDQKDKLVLQHRDSIALDSNFSTTRLLTRQQPVFERKPGDKFETFLFQPAGEERKGEGGLRTRGLFKQNSQDKLLVTVITVVFNGEKHLEETIQSVITQTYDNVEYIIIDGRSTDGTLNIIKKYENQIDYWLSESDRGIYDAMNKGLALATGELVGIINADDWYQIDVIDSVVSEYRICKEAIFHGGMRYFMSNLLIFRRPGCPDTAINFKEMAENHPSMFVPISVYKKIGCFDERYKIISDWDFVTRCHRLGIHFIWINKDMVNFRVGGASSRLSIARLKEKWSFRRNHNFKNANLYLFLDLAKFFVAVILKLSGCSNFYKSYKHRKLMGIYSEKSL